MRKVLVTGVTGFLGRYILRCVLEDKGAGAIVLARGKARQGPAERVADALRYLYGDDRYEEMLGRVRVVDGEVDRKNLGMDDDTRRALIEEVDEIFHSAAIAEFRVPLDKIRMSNVEGARNVFDFALECRIRGRLSRINHVSTTYVAGDRPGIFHENELMAGQGFYNTYEQSKFEAECMIASYRERGLPITVFRPSILTGDSAQGKTSNFKMLYQPLHFFANELFAAVPADPGALENLMPTDIAAREIFLISKESRSVNGTYHIASPTCVTAGHFVDVASDFFGFRKPELIPVGEFDMDTLTTAQKMLIDPFIPYFNYKTSFDITNTRSILKKAGFIYPGVDDEQLIRIFKFCADSGFVKRTGSYVSA